MRRMTIGLIAGILATGAAGAGLAQISRGGEPFMLGADEFELIQDQGVQIWRGRAEALQGENRLRAGELRVYHAMDDGGALMRVEADGDVYFVTPDQVARGARAVYTAADDTLVVTGDVILRQGDNVLTGSRLTINVASGRARMDGAPAGSAGRRVQGVFYPDRN